MKKLLSLLLGVCLIVSIIPLASSAEESVTPKLDVTAETPIAGQAPSYEDTYSLIDARYDALKVSRIVWYYSRTDSAFNGDYDSNWAPMNNDVFKADCYYAYAITFANMYPREYDIHAWKNCSTINGGSCGFAYDIVNQLFTLYIKLGQPEAPDIPDSTASPTPSASPTAEPSQAPEPTEKPPVEPTEKPTAEPIIPLSFSLDGYKVDANIINGLTVSGDEDKNEGIGIDSWAVTKVLSTKDSFNNDIITDESARFEPVTDYYLAVQFLLDDGYDISRYNAENITLEGYGTAAALFENGNNGYTAMFKLPKLYRDVSALHFTLDGYEIDEYVADTIMINDLNNEGIAWGENFYLTHFSISDTEITLDNYEDNAIDDEDYVFEKDTDYYLCLTLPSLYGYTAENLKAEDITLDGYGTASAVEFIDESDEEEGVNGFVAFFKLPQLKETTPEPTVTPEPTAEPTAEPTSTPEPTAEPTAEPTSTPEPTAEPTATPTTAPTATPERSVIVTPTPTPTQSPTPEPTEVPSGNGGSGTSGEKSTTVVTASASPATTPATGDNSNMGIWYAVLAVSALGIVGTSLIGKAKKK